MNKQFLQLQTGYITVYGYWFYWIDNETVAPAAFVTVAIYDQELDESLVLLNYALTNLNGYFVSDPILNDDGLGEGGLDIVVRVMTASSVAMVIDPETSWYYYSQTEVFENCPDGPLPIGARITSWDDRGAWWIFSAQFGLTRGYRFLYDEVNYVTPTITAFWPYGDWPHYGYNETTGTMFLPDWACWWSHIILHEYGHHVMYSLYGYIPPSMEDHYIEKQSNSTTAWAEGWANFFPLAVFDNPIYTWANATHYGDINLETPHWCSSGWDDGDEVEGRVAGALWDIFDSDDDGYDVLDLDDGFHRIWNITRDENPDTFKEFWDAWNTTYCDDEWTNTLMAMFQNSIDYRGPGDVNADGIVEGRDLYLVNRAYGSEKGEPKWDQRCDMNYDDSIQGTDLYFVADHYGNLYNC